MPLPIPSLRLATALLSTALLSGASVASAAPEFVTLLVKPRAHASETALEAAYAAHGAKEFDRIPALDVRLLRVPAVAAERVQRALSRRADVAYAEPDATAHAFATPNDPFLGQQWHLAKIQAPAAWDFGTGSSQVVIAILDSGVNAAHPDLAGRLLPGYDFVNNDANPHDDNGHGTAVAGVAAAAGNNALGVAGVAYASPILPVKVLGADGSGSHSAIARGILFAADSGARVINLSLGGTSSSQTLQDAVNYAWGKSAVLVAAAGNSGNTVANYPAACANVVAVSATDASDLRPSWSNYGSTVDLSAPGAGILSLSLSGGYSSWNGTSFASPVASGVAALVASAAPAASNARIVDLLLKNADDRGAAGYDSTYGHGRVNAARAVQAARASSAVDTTPPVATFAVPAAGATVSGTVTISGDATDNVGVTRTELRIDGALVASANAAALSHAWNTTAYSNAAHSLELRAYDAAGQVGATTRSVTVANHVAVDTTPPVAAITSPGNYSRITSQYLNITIRATDNVAVAKVDLYIDGRFAATSSSATPTFTWNTLWTAYGAHRLQAYATDKAGKVGASPVITVYK